MAGWFAFGFGVGVLQVWIGTIRMYAYFLGARVGIRRLSLILVMGFFCALGPVAKGAPRTVDTGGVATDSEKVVLGGRQDGDGPRGGQIVGMANREEDLWLEDAGEGDWMALDDPVGGARLGGSWADPVIPETEAVIAAVGDIIPHSPLQRQADEDGYGYRSAWLEIESVFRAADLVYGNLETPLAADITVTQRRLPRRVERYDGVAYTGYPQFNAHPKLAMHLKQAGFDIVSTANNHSLDRGPIGIDLTLEALRAAGLKSVGTRHREAANNTWYVVTQVRSYRVAWLACTYGTNGLPDRHGQVLKCFRDGRRILGYIRTLSQRSDIDAVILTPHFGAEYRSNPTKQQRRFARRAVEAGAVAVIGSHPHVVQPWERWRTRDGREGFILYSLGNFISNQQSLKTRTSLVVMLGIGLTVSGRIGISGFRYLPIFMDRQDDGAGGTRLSLRVAGVSEGAESRSHLTGLLGTASETFGDGPFTTMLEGRANATGEPDDDRYEGGSVAGGQADTIVAAIEGPSAPSSGRSMPRAEGLVGSAASAWTRLSGLEGPSGGVRAGAAMGPAEGPVALVGQGHSPRLVEGQATLSSRAVPVPAEGPVPIGPLATQLALNEAGEPLSTTLNEDAQGDSLRFARLLR